MMYILAPLFFFACETATPPAAAPGAPATTVVVTTPAAKTPGTPAPQNGVELNVSDDGASIKVKTDGVSGGVSGGDGGTTVDLKVKK